MTDFNSNPIKEIWKPVAGFEIRYMVSNLGRVWSIPFAYQRPEWRKGTLQNVCVGGNFLRGRIRLQNDKPVCVLVSLRDNTGKPHTKRVHRIVLESFIGPAPKGTECCHYNGDPTDNRLENLRWDTRKRNQLDSVRHGTKQNPPTHYGETHPRATVADYELQKIREMEYRRGLFSELAKEYGVAPITIRRWYYGESRL